MVPSDKYAKIVYESDPIGVERIVLVLTTFDIEKYNEDQRLLEIPKKIEGIKYEIPRYALNDRDELHKYLEDFESRTNAFIKNRYESQIELLTRELELRKSQIQSLTYHYQQFNDVEKPISFYPPYL